MNDIHMALVWQENDTLKTSVVLHVLRQSTLYKYGSFIILPQKN